MLNFQAQYIENALFCLFLERTMSFRASFVIDRTIPREDNYNSMLKRKGIILLLFLVVAVTAHPQDEASRLLNRLDSFLSTAEERLATTPTGSVNESPNFFVVNNTGFTIRSIFVSRAENGIWGDNVLPHLLHNGQNASINPGLPLDGTTLYNIRLVDVDGDYFGQFNITLSPRTRVRIGIGDFQWDRD